MSEHTVTLLHEFPSAVHFGLITPSAEVDSKSTRTKIRNTARAWARKQGVKITGPISGGATVGPVESETRLIFSVTR